jgi:CrcB protein
MDDRAPDLEPDPVIEPRPAIGPVVDSRPAIGPVIESRSAAPDAATRQHWTGADVHTLPVDPDVEPEDRVRRGPVERRRHPLVRLLAERRDVLAVIAVGGALGALARWGTSVAWPAGTGAFPWATLQVNTLGAFLIGVLMVLVRTRGRESRLLRPFLGVGVLGGYTTFSTYSRDIHQLLLDHRAGLAGAYLVASVALGLVGAWLGLLAGGAVARSLPDADGDLA